MNPALDGRVVLLVISPGHRVLRSRCSSLAVRVCCVGQSSLADVAIAVRRQLVLGLHVILGRWLVSDAVSRAVVRILSY